MVSSDDADACVCKQCKIVVDMSLPERLREVAKDIEVLDWHPEAASLREAADLIDALKQAQSLNTSPECVNEDDIPEPTPERLELIKGHLEFLSSGLLPSRPGQDDAYDLAIFFAHHLCKTLGIEFIDPRVKWQAICDANARAVEGAK